MRPGSSGIYFDYCVLEVKILGFGLLYNIQNQVSSNAKMPYDFSEKTSFNHQNESSNCESIARSLGPGFNAQCHLTCYNQNSNWMNK